MNPDLAKAARDARPQPVEPTDDSSDDVAPVSTRRQNRVPANEAVTPRRQSRAPAPAHPLTFVPVAEQAPTQAPIPRVHVEPIASAPSAPVNVLDDLLTKMAIREQEARVDRAGRAHSNRCSDRVLAYFRELDGKINGTSVGPYTTAHSDGLFQKIISLSVHFDIVGYFLDTFYTPRAREFISSLIYSGAVFTDIIDKLSRSGMAVADVFFILVLVRFAEVVGDISDCFDANE